MQPYFFPYIGYFQLIHAVDKIVLYDRVNYIKKGWINRNRILEINHGPVFIYIPIKKGSQFTKISEIRIDNSVPWGKKIIDILYHNYKKATHFDEMYPLFKVLLNEKYEWISDFNYKSTLTICELLGINKTIITDTSEYAALEESLADSNSEVITYYRECHGIDDVKTIRILEMCKNEKAHEYVNAIGGKELYNRDVFESNDMKLWFTQTLPYSYHQNRPTFIPDLSIMDVLMHNGVNRTRELLVNYALI